MSDDSDHFQNPSAKNSTPAFSTSAFDKFTLKECGFENCMPKGVDTTSEKIKSDTCSPSVVASGSQDTVWNEDKSIEDNLSAHNKDVQTKTQVFTTDLLYWVSYPQLYWPCPAFLKTTSWINYNLNGIYVVLFRVLWIIQDILRMRFSFTIDYNTLLGEK